MDYTVLLNETGFPLLELKECRKENGVPYFILLDSDLFFYSPILIMGEQYLYECIEVIRYSLGTFLNYYLEENE